MPPQVVMSLSFRASGSYNREAMLKYLDCHLPKLTPKPIEACDFRILALDAYEVHKLQEVRDFCLGRGFLVIYHRGGSTVIGQWNDTGLHGTFEREYSELEQIDFSQQLLRCPWKCPSRPRQSIVTDCACIWSVLPHAQLGREESMRTGWGVHSLR